MTRKKNEVTFEAWLKNNVTGYRDLNNEIKALILYFVVAWSLFEDKLLGEGKKRSRINTFVDNSITNATEMDPFKPAFRHFVERYVTEGATNAAFDALVERNKGYKHDIKRALLTENLSNPRLMKALLFIVYCLRNNMIHGVKWNFGYDAQVANLDHSIGVLMHLLDAHAPKKDI